MEKYNFRFYWEEPYEKKEPNISIEVPAFGRDEIKVDLTENTITVSAAKKSQKVEKGKNFYRAEVSASSFSKSMSLPHKINPDDFSVIVEDGKVTLIRRKKKQAEAR